MVAYKSSRVIVRSERREACGSSQRECDDLSFSLTRANIACQELAVRERGSREDAGVNAADL